MLSRGSRIMYHRTWSTVPGKPVAWINERVLMCHRSGDRLWWLRHDRKNLWREGLWENPLNSKNGCPMAFEGKLCFTLEVAVVRMSWTICKQSVVICYSVLAIFTCT